MVAKVLEYPTLVLNRNWQPVNLATVARALVLLWNESARVVDPADYRLAPPDNLDKTLDTTNADAINPSQGSSPPDTLPLTILVSPLRSRRRGQMYTTLRRLIVATRVLLMDFPILASVIDSSSAIVLTDLNSSSPPAAINFVGQVAGHTANRHTAHWDAASLTSLRTLGGAATFDSDITDGSVVAWSTYSRDLWVSARLRPFETHLGARSIGALPFTLDLTTFVAVFSQHRPSAVLDTRLRPALKCELPERRQNRFANSPQRVIDLLLCVQPLAQWDATLLVHVGQQFTTIRRFY